MKIFDITGRVLCEIDGDTLIGADLHRADLIRANLTVANLAGANLTGANLTGAKLYRADLHGANLHRANLTGADLTRADLTGANLTGTNLHGANLHGAKLYRADLHGANLHRANLTGANGIIVFGPCPSSSGRIGYIVGTDDGQTVYLGCWQGGVEPTCERIHSEYPGPIGDAYAGLVRAASVALASRTVKAQAVEA